MRTVILTCALAAAILACGPAGSAPIDLGARPVVVELFTSQGCSSCPPADELLTKLGSDPALRGRVIPLAFHVDYWDHLGWRDPFSSSQWSARQQSYAAPFGWTLYTPQLVVNGTADAVGSDARKIRGLIEQASKRASAARIEIVSVDRTAHGLTVRVRGVSSQPAVALVALFENGLATSVPRGENSGRNLQNDFVVRDLQKAFTTDARGQGDQTLAIELPPSATLANVGIVAMLQSETSREVLAAATQRIEIEN